MILDETINAKDAWLKQVKHHRKRLKGLPRVGFNPNAGNVEYNISMMNKMLGSGEMLSNNPISGPFGGDVSAPAGGASMGESLNEAVYNNVELSRDMENFLADNLALIDANDFQELYNKLDDVAFGSEAALTGALIYADINPLNYLVDIPTYYACLLDIPEVTIPKNIKSINEYAFNSCHSLEAVIIEEGCQYLGENAFENCSELSEVYLPESIEEIDSNCFRNCPKLVNIIYAGTVEDWENISIYSNAFDNIGTNEIKCSDDIYVIN